MGWIFTPKSRVITNPSYDWWLWAIQLRTGPLSTNEVLMMAPMLQQKWKYSQWRSTCWSKRWGVDMFFLAEVMNMRIDMSFLGQDWVVGCTFGWFKKWFLVFGCWTKKRGGPTPQIIHLFIGVCHYKSSILDILGETNPIFGSTPQSLTL